MHVRECFNLEGGQYNWGTFIFTRMVIVKSNETAGDKVKLLSKVICKTWQFRTLLPVLSLRIKEQRMRKTVML